MRRKYQDRKHITVYLDADEYERVRKIAGADGRISEWARETLLGELGDSPAVRAQREVRVARRSTPASERPAKRIGIENRMEPCKHGAYPGLCKFEECRRK